MTKARAEPSKLVKGALLFGAWLHRAWSALGVGPRELHFYSGLVMIGVAVYILFGHGWGLLSVGVLLFFMGRWPPA